MNTDGSAFTPAFRPAMTTPLRGSRFTKKASLFLLLGLMALGGCARHYVVRLSRGTTITSKGKPRLDKTTGCYVFTDTKGRQQVIPASAIREIAPASMSSDSTLPPLKTSPAR